MSQIFIFYYLFRHKIQDIYFPISLFVHIEYKYINNIDWYTCGNGGAT